MIILFQILKLLLVRYDIYLEVYKQPDLWKITGGILMELELDLELGTLLVKEIFVSALYVQQIKGDPNSMGYFI